MILIRLSEIGTDQQLLVNPNHIIHVRALQKPRGLQRRALRLVLHLVDGSQLDCFPLDDVGGFDSTTDDESVALRNFQLAVRYMQNHPAAEQGSRHPKD